MSRADVRRVPETKTITFSSGSSGSSVADIRNAEHLGIITSTAFGSSQVTFRVGSSSGTLYDLYASSTQVVLTVSTNSARAYEVDMSRPVFAPWSWLQIVGNSTSDAARTWTLVGK